MKFGLGLPCVHPMNRPPWTDDKVVHGIAQVALKAEELGYCYVSCCDHPIIPKQSAPAMGVRWFDPISTLGFVGGMTEKIKLLSSVMVLPYRSPFDLAKAFGSIDTLTNGRVIMGVGVGHLKKEFSTLGANYNHRGQVTDEQISIIRALWTRDSASYHGKFWDFDNLMISPRPASEFGPPIWVGGSTVISARRAGRIGDGWHPFGITIDQFKRGVEAAKEEATQSNNPRSLDFSIGTGTISNREIVVDLIEQRIEAGATVIGLDFQFSELDELLESLNWFAETIMPEFSQPEQDSN